MGGLRQAGRQGQEESSFFGKKEAKKLYPSRAGFLNHPSQVTKVFLLLFFQKKKILPSCHLPRFFRGSGQTEASSV
jgi:hypothetical protein